MILIFNSSPLIYLAKIKVLKKIEKIPGKKLISPCVYHEVVKKGEEKGEPDAFLIDDLVEKKILSIKEIRNKKFVKHLKRIPKLDYADVETLALAKELKAVAIIDEIVARNVAEIEGVEYAGSVSILFKLLRLGIVNKKQTKEYVDKMISLGWRCSTQLYSIILDELEKV